MTAASGTAPTAAIACPADAKRVVMDIAQTEINAGSLVVVLLDERLCVTGVGTVAHKGRPDGALVDVRTMAIDAKASAVILARRAPIGSALHFIDASAQNILRDVDIRLLDVIVVDDKAVSMAERGLL